MTREEKMWYLYIMDYYSIIKNNEILSFPATWKFEDVILSEMNKAQKHKYTTCSLLICTN
jgi:hypothetical protein